MITVVVAQLAKLSNTFSQEYKSTFWANQFQAKFLWKYKICMHTLSAIAYSTVKSLLATEEEMDGGQVW